MPAAVIHNSLGESQCKDGQCGIEHQRTCVYQSSRKGADLFGYGEIMERGCCREFAPEFRNSANKVVQDDGAGADNAGYNLAACE